MRASSHTHTHTQYVSYVHIIYIVLLPMRGKNVQGGRCGGCDTEGVVECDRRWKFEFAHIVLIKQVLLSLLLAIITIFIQSPSVNNGHFEIHFSYV